MFRWGPAAFLIAAMLMLANPACAERRVALVVGNSGYQHVAPLINPSNDAQAIAATFKDAGFDIVEFRRDLKLSEMRRVLRDFADKTRDADIAVVYYAGHGIEVEGTNYLLPTDAVLERDTDIYDEAFSLDRILITVEPAKQLRLVILDACRDNPFSKTMKRTIGTRTVSRGLAKVEPTSPNTLIAFASKAGSTAADGDSLNSPFTAALLKHIATPGLDLRKAFGFVRDDVLKNTSNRQEPYVYGSLGGNDVALVAAKPIPSTPLANPLSETRRDYELALQIGSKEVWRAFLNQYPTGFYADLAKAQLTKIDAEDARNAATEKARIAVEEKSRLAAEGARKAEQSRAEAALKAAEIARVAAEKVNAVEQARAAEAEAKRVTVEKDAADKAAKGEASREGAERTRAEAAEVADSNSADADLRRVIEQPPSGQKLAALPTTQDLAPLTSRDAKAVLLAQSVQTELRRVGCHTGKIDDDWSASARRSLERFNKRTGLRLNVEVASIDTLDAIKAKPARICPLACKFGFRADGEQCRKITCSAGYFLNDGNECEKKERSAIRPSSRPLTRQPAAQLEQRVTGHRHGLVDIGKNGGVDCAGTIYAKMTGAICR